MNKTIMISLPVADLTLSRAFYTEIGFAENPDFQYEGSAHMICSETISVMLLTHEKWKILTARPIAPKPSSEVGLNISCGSREEVDAMNRAAAKYGEISDVNPVDDFPFMYGRDFTDPDGHVWGRNSLISPLSRREFGKSNWFAANNWLQADVSDEPWRELKR